ncbi:MAG: EAL domain-containing protein [Lachnospiraceae bacterium]|nr:EAL domain-containing protein [Lachnospiraceae bacterium]
MANIKEEKLRKLKKSFTGGSIVAMLLLGAVIFAAFAITLVVFCMYIIDSKVRTEFDTISKIAEVYDRSGESDAEDLMSVMYKGDRDYIITDADRKIISEHGNNTCDLSKGGTVDLLGIAASAREEAQEELKEHHDVDLGIDIDTSSYGQITVYPDKHLPVIRPNRFGMMRIDPKMVRPVISKIKQEAESAHEIGKALVNVPYWIEVPLENGTNMVCRSDFSVYLREMAVIGILSAIILLFTTALIVFMIVFLIKAFVRRKRMNEVFYMDEITGNYNWLWFIKFAEEELKKKKNASKKYAVLDIVFANYRNFCVCHSLDEGNRMLVLIDKTIRTHIDPKKELAAHHSAAHFAVMMTYTDRDDLEVRIKAMISDLEKINSDHKFNYWIGIDRIGESTDENGRPEKRENVDVERSYSNAGAARATLSGNESAIAFFDEKMIEEQKWIDNIVENQDKALENEEFLVYYQPKYDPRTNELKGAEALIRWKSPQYGLISPGRFIPLFEENGFITNIDHYMLRHVAQDQKKWLDEGFACVPVSVNVSRAHFIEADLAEQIRDIVDEAGTTHDLVEIELTESAFFDDKDALITTIRKLKDYGFTVSMDDFGSGYSSLNSLKEMPLDVLKLDAEFFRNGDQDGRGQIVVSEAIKLAKKLDMRTVAEGVEVKDQVDFLAEEGCDMIQGFFFAKPMPKDEYVQKLSTNV